MTPTVQTPEYQLPTQTGADQDDPFVIALPDGRFFVVWKDDDNTDDEFIDADGEDIAGQFFSADGTPDGGAFQINTDFETGDQADPVALTFFDNLFVFFEDEDSSPDAIIGAPVRSNGEVDSQFGVADGNTPQVGRSQPDRIDIVFDRNNDVFLFSFGEAEAPTTIPVITGSTGVFGTALAILADGTFAIAASVADVSGTRSLIVQRYDPATEALIGSPIPIDDGPQIFEDVALVDLAGGGFAISFTEGPDVFSKVTRVAVYDNAGTKLKTITLDPGDATEDSTLISLPNGDFFVFWENDTESTGYGQRYSSTGEPVSDTFVVGDIQGVSDLTAALSDDGRLFVVYEASNDGLFGTVFDIHGEAIAADAPEPEMIWKAEHQLPKTDGSDHDEPAATAIGSGRYVAVWTDDDGAANPQFGRTGNDVGAQILDARGNPVGDAFQINTTTATGNASDATVARRPDGGFVAVYEERVGDVEAIRITTFDVDGKEVGGRSTTIAAADASTPTIAGNVDGAFLVAYQESSSGAVKAKIVGSDGSIGGEMLIEANANVSSVTALSDGSFAVALDVSDDVVIHTVSALGVVGAPIAVTDDTLNQSQPVVAGLAGGGVAVAYTEYYGGFANADVRIAVYDVSGGLVKGPFTVDGDYRGNDNEPAITALADGGFVVLWDNDQADTVDGQRFDVEGNPVGDPFIANGFGLPGDPVVITLEDGRIFTVASDRSGTDAHFGAIYDFRAEDSFIGAAGPDLLVATPSGSFLKGKKGKDILIGAKGDDNLKGNKGKDLLIGDGGNDLLKGGKSADQFAFVAALDKNTNVDAIAGFNRKQGDTIVLLDDIFGAVGQKMNKSEFVKGKKAKDDNDHIIFKTGNGNKPNKLFYDADGKGGDKKVLFATLDGKVKRKDFEVIDDLVI